MVVKTLDYLNQLEHIVEKNIGTGSISKYPIKLINRRSDIRLLENPLLMQVGEIVLPDKIDRFQNNKKNVMSLNLLINFLTKQTKKYLDATSEDKVRGVESAMASFFASSFYKTFANITYNNNKKQNENPQLLMDIFIILNNYVLLNEIFSEYKGLENYFKQSETPSRLSWMFQSFKTTTDRFVDEFSKVLYYDTDLDFCYKPYRKILEECIDTASSKQTASLNELVFVTEKIYNVIKEHFNVNKYKSEKKSFNLFTQKNIMRLTKQREIAKRKQLENLFGINLPGYVEECITDNEISAIYKIQHAINQLFLKDYGTHLEYEGEDLDMEEWLDNELTYKATGIKNANKMFIEEYDNPTEIATAVLVDVSGSTSEIINQIRTSMLIYTKALADTNFLNKEQKIPLGLYWFTAKIGKLHDFKWDITSETYNKILSIRSGGDTNLYKGLKKVSEDIRPISAKKKLILIVTDGMTDYVKETKELFSKLEREKIYPILVVIGKNLEKHAKALSKNYSVIGREEVYMLGDELLRLFNTYGLCD